jgi:hypothetical protein
MPPDFSSVQGTPGAAPAPPPVTGQAR